MTSAAESHREEMPATRGPGLGLVTGSPAIRITGLTKRYRSPLTLKLVHVLRGFDLEITPGEIFGFLGLNGAGKTTTIRCLVGLIRPSEGSVSIFGQSPLDPAVRRRIGYLSENPTLPDYLTPVEVLDLAGRLCALEPAHRRRRIGELLAALRLERFASMPLRKLSKGNAQRVGIAQAVIHEPDLLILDEPMSGLDPLGRRDVRDLMDDLRARGRTIFFSSHIVPDVESMCDRVAILDRGRVQRVGRIEELTTVKLQGVEIRVRNTPPGLLERLLAPGDEIEGRGPTTRILVCDADRVDFLLMRVLEAGGRIEALDRRRERLEDYFVRTAGEEAA
jgi:ABC-2 type transport system ATP-binding protein